MLKDVVVVRKSLLLKNHVRLIKPGSNADHSLCDGNITIFGPDFSICVGGAYSSEDYLIPNKLYYLLFGGILGLNIKKTNLQLFLGIQLKDYYRNTHYLNHLTKFKKFKYSLNGELETKSVQLLEVKAFTNIYGLGLYFSHEFGVANIMVLRIYADYFEAMYFNANLPCEAQSFILGLGYTNWREIEDNLSKSDDFKSWDALNEKEKIVEHQEYLQSYVLKKMRSLTLINMPAILFFSLPKKLEDDNMLAVYQSNIKPLASELLQFKDEHEMISNGMNAFVEVFSEVHNTAYNVCAAMSKEFSIFFTGE